MIDYEVFRDTLEAILIHDEKNAEKYLETLNVIVTLMNELGSGRFNGAKYTRTFHHGKLNIIVQYVGDGA